MSKAYFSSYGLPSNLPPREIEHLTTCERCAAVFPLAIYHADHSIPDAYAHWASLSESERRAQEPLWLEKHRSYLLQYTKSKTASAYQLYLSDHHREKPGNEIMAQTKQWAEEWKRMSPDQKRPYEHRSAALAQEFHRTIDSWPKPFVHEWKQLKQLRKQTKNSQKRPTSAFVLFMKDRWGEQKAWRTDYREFQKEMGQFWKSGISPEIKRQYEDIAAGQSQRYQKQKSASKHVTALSSDDEDSE